MVPEIRSEIDRIFCHFGPLFSFFPNDPENQHFEKKMKNMPGDIILLYMHVYHKRRSYDIWFLKYKVRHTEIFVIFGPFSALSIP